MWRLHSVSSVRKKILITGSIALLLVASVIILFSAYAAYTSSVSDAEQNLHLVASSQADLVRSVLERPMMSAEGLGQALIGPYADGSPLPRQSVHPQLKQILTENPLYNGVFTMWEEDAYDKQDHRYAGRDGYAASGRMNQYYYREAGNAVRYEYDPAYDDVSQDYTLSYYLLPKSSHVPTLTDPYIEEIEGRPVLMASASVPLLSQGTFLGVTGVDVTLADLDMIADRTTLYQGRGKMIIVSNDLTIAGITGDLGKVGEPLSSLSETLQVSGDALNQSARTNGTYHLGEYIGETVPVIVGDPQKSWSVMILVPAAVLTEDALFLTGILVLFGICVSTGGLFLLNLVARSITRPIQEITRAAEAISGGELSYRVNIDGQDEIAGLGRAIDHMATQIEETMKRVRMASEAQKAVLDEVTLIARAAASGNLRKRGDPSRFSGDGRGVIEAINATLDAIAIPLHEAMRISGRYASGDFTARFNPDVLMRGSYGEFSESLESIGIRLGLLIGNVRGRITSLTEEMSESARSVAEVASGSQQIAKGTAVLSSQADSCKQRLEEISGAVAQMTELGIRIAGETDQLTTYIHQTSTLSEAGSADIAETNAGMASILASQEEMNTVIHEISAHMDTIGSIVSIITGIAEQTNLLALNAAIEAARAGNAGKGFAVVAGEVKALAGECQQSAEKIRSIITGLREQIDLMFSAVERSQQELSTGDHAVRDTLALLSDLSLRIGSINARIAGINADSQRQHVEADAIAGNVLHLDEAFERTLQELGNTAALTEESSVSLDCIAEYISEAKGQIEEISTEMSKFKVDTDPKTGESRER